MPATFYNEAVIAALADHGEIKTDSIVVDVGSGTGYIAAGLASHVAKVVAVDNSPAMLAVAEQNSAALGIWNVTTREADLTALTFGDAGVDAAVANMALHHAPYPAAMGAEMARVVRPGGMVAITDEVEHCYKWMRTGHADLWLGFTEPDVRTFFHGARLVEYGYAPLGHQ